MRLLRLLRGALLGMVLLTMGGSGSVVAAAQERSPLVQQTAEQIAVREAEGWLALVDAGKYAESWKMAAAVLRGAVTMENWESTLKKTARGPLGKFESRKLQSAGLTTTLPGAPDGEYVVAKFDTSFEHKAAAVETVIVSHEKDGSWRVAGYFIK